MKTRGTTTDLGYIPETEISPKLKISLELAHGNGTLPLQTFEKQDFDFQHWFRFHSCRKWSLKKMSKWVVNQQLAFNV
jgi:hypothetical protein